MEGLIESIAQLTWQDLLTVASVLFGVVSLIGYFEQRKAARQQASLARFAQLNVDKAVTEEDLEALEGRRASMEAEVLESIPGLARQAVLRQQVAEHSKAASEHFRQLRLLEDELGDAHESSGLDQAIRAEIVDRLLPEYERQRNLDELRNRITVFSVSIALAGTIAPAPLDIALAVVLAGPLVRSLVQFGRVQVERERFEQLVGQAVLGAYAGVLALVSAWAGVLFTFNRDWALGTVPVWSAVALLAALGMALSPVVWRWAKRLAAKTAGSSSV